MPLRDVPVAGPLLDVTEQEEDPAAKWHVRRALSRSKLRLEDAPCSVQLPLAEQRLPRGCTAG